MTEEKKPSVLQGLMSRLWGRTSRPEIGQAPIYQGTADRKVVERRRAANKRARISRRVNRLRSR